MRVCVLGTGLMGAGMARSLRRAGLDVTVWNRTRAKAEPLAADGIEVADSIGTAVAGADAVITMLYDADAVLAVEDEVTTALSGQVVWLQSATVGVAIDGSASNSPYAQLKGKAMLAGEFAPSFELDGARKDVGLIAEAHIDHALIDGLRSLFDTASEQGHGADDMAAVFTAFG